MAGSDRADFGSCGFDGSTFGSGHQSGQRGAYAGSSLERSGSFRESLENRILVSGPSACRASSMEMPPMSQFLTLELFPMSEQKHFRPELRRALGLTVEEHNFSSIQSKALPPIAFEDLKRFKASVLDSSNKARERAKLLHESIIKLERYRNSLQRKRQRLDQSSEKSGNSNLLKMGNQGHPNFSDLISQRLEDKTKNIIPNKRVRSSMADSEGRAAIPARQGAVTEKDKSLLFDKDKSILWSSHAGPAATEDKTRGLPPGGDGWEKKIKRKRSVGSMVNRGIDGDREIKQENQQRPNVETRPRSSDGNGFRPGSSSGIVGNNKMDNGVQVSVVNSRTVLRNELDTTGIPNERKERSLGLDKERGVPKGSNKLASRDDAQTGNQSPLTKGKASRGPRSSSGGVMSTPNFGRIVGGADQWEQSPGVVKVPQLAVLTNRKRPLPTGSSSPPVAQWGGQRLQKSSRTRRANVVSPVSNLDEGQFLSDSFSNPDNGTRLTPMDPSGLPLSRGTSNNSHQSKIKLESTFSPAGFSESEESGATENKFKEKGSDNIDLEDETLNTSHKGANFVLPMKKNKPTLKEEIGDGVRRQGRSGRGSIQPKSSLSILKEKSENLDAAKPVKIGKLGPDKNESKIGRPPTKKMSDRKIYGRPGQIIASGSPDLTGESDDDREELLAAANAARNASYNGCSSIFWKKMEPFFVVVTLEEVSYIKQQIIFCEELDASLHSRTDFVHQSMGDLTRVVVGSSPAEQMRTTHGTTNSFGNLCSVDRPREKTAAGKSEMDRWFEKMVPMAQILLSAIITEDETESLDYNTEGDSFLQFSSEYFSYRTNQHVINEYVKDFTKSELHSEQDYKNQSSRFDDVIACNGFMSCNSGRLNSHTYASSEEPPAENNVMLPSVNGSIMEYGQTDSNQLHDIAIASPYECQFELMPFSDRILLELHSIGLFPDTVPDLAEGEEGELDKMISELKMKLYEQVKNKNSQLYKLEKAIQDVKETEERNLEQLAVNNLVETSYKKLMGGRGGSSHKSSASKASKQIALAFAKRTLAKCQQFEETGRSCFREPFLWDVISSAPSHIDAKHADGVLPSATERDGVGNKFDTVPIDPYPMPDQSFAKNGLVSNRMKKREVLLDDVVAGAASRSISTPIHTLPSGPKWKRTDRERDQSRDSFANNSSSKAGRPSVSNGRGERKTKMKPKQKIAQLSTSGNGLGRVTEMANFMSPIPDSSELVNNLVSFQETELQSSSSVAHDSSKDIDDAIFTNLPNGIDSIDELELDGQGQDIGSWLNVDEEGLQDHDLVGLEIPMDDLSDIKMNF